MYGHFLQLFGSWRILTECSRVFLEELVDKKSKENFEKSNEYDILSGIKSFYDSVIKSGSGIKNR